VDSEPKLTSSYPDVQPLLIEADADVHREFKRSPRRHAIVSIDGEDVDDRTLEKRKIA
jgi:NAD kinase